MTSPFALAPSDYEVFDQKMVMLTSQITLACVDVEINQDESLEVDEMFLVTLTSSDPAAILEPDVTEITILDDDGMLASKCSISHTSGHCITIKCMLCY